MPRFSIGIYHNGETAPFCSTSKLTQNESFMGQNFVSITIESPAAIGFKVGDYLTYRGRKFVLAVTPSMQKQARVNSVGNAIKYDNIKFISVASDELTRCEFRDVVNSTTDHYNFAARTFSFHCLTLKDYAERLKANLDRMYGGYTIKVLLEDGNTYTVGSSAPYNNNAVGEKNKVIQISNETCWDSLQHVKADFKVNLYFDGDRTIVLGANGHLIAQHHFAYGAGEGLFKISRTTDESQAIITRLRAYGSEKNMPARFYANLKYLYLLPKEMIVEAKTSKTSIDLDKGTTDFVNDGYLTIGFDGNMLANSSLSESNKFTSPSNGAEKYLIKVRINNVSGWMNIQFNGADNTSYANIGWNNASEYGNNTETSAKALVAEFCKMQWTYFIIEDGATETWKYKVTDPSCVIPNNMNVKCLMLAGFGFSGNSLRDEVKAVYDRPSTDASKKLIARLGYPTFADFSKDFALSDDPSDPYIDAVPQKEAYGVREGTVVFDGTTEDYDEIYPSIEYIGGVDTCPAQRGKVDGSDRYEGNNLRNDGGVIDDLTEAGKEIPQFYLYIKDPFFNPYDYRKSGSDSFKINMIDGMCGGRSFDVKQAKRCTFEDGSTGYRLVCDRVEDNSLDLYFPYSQIRNGLEVGYIIKAGDRYTFSDIEMPSEYVLRTALYELFPAAVDALKKNRDVRFKYELSVDANEMHRQHLLSLSDADTDSIHDTVHAGDLILFGDKDLGVNYDEDEPNPITGSVIINSIEIKENNERLPQYSIRLVDEKTIGTIERIQRQIESIVNGSNASGSSISGYAASEIQRLIRTYGANYFLSKANDDIAKGKITFEQGLTSKEASTFEKDVRIEGTTYTKDIVNDNKITTKDLEVTGSAHFYELVIDKARKTSAISLQSVASAKLDIVTHDDSIYHCFFLAKDEDDRQITNDFLVNDQILMMTFNVGVGVSYDVGNRYYWAKCSGVSSEPVTIDGKEYHWIDIDMSVRATNSNAVPQPEDEIVVLGHQSAAHTERQNTIIYASIDNSFLNLRQPDADVNGNHPLLKAPMIVQLHGIDSFGIYYDNPNNYGNVISRGYNSLRGRLRSMTSSQDDVEVKVEDTSAQKVYYLCTATLSTPSAAAAGWSENCVPTDATPYIWKKTIKTYFDGTSEPFVEFVNKYQKGETGAPGKDGTDGTDGRDGKDGQGITFDGELWSEQLVADKGGLLPKLYAVRMYNKIYIVVNPEGTANPPIWCYTDSEGNRLTYSDGGYVLAQDDDGNLMENTDDWEPMSQFGADGKDGYTPIKGIDYFDGYTPVKGVDYFDGKDGDQGVGVKYINVFKRGNVAQMDKPNDASCDFDNPIPKGWTDGVPAGSETCWITTRPFYTDGRETDWCKPVPMTDTADFDCCFSKDVEKPSAPTSHGTQADVHWHNDPQEGDRWMATSVCRNGEWSKWQITQILGEAGKPAYLHTAYCNSITTWKDFTVENPNGQRYAYVGTYTDSKPEDSTDPTSYRWVFVQGVDGQNINARGEWKEGITLEHMDSVTFEGVTYLYLGEELWTGYPRSKYLDRDGNVLRYHDGGLVWVNDGMPCLFETDSRFEVLTEDGLSLVLVKGFDVAKVNGKASHSIFTFADEQQALVEFRRGTNAIDNGVTYSIALSGCSGITMMQAGSVCAVNISRSSTVNSTKVDGFDYYLPVSDCQVTVNCTYRGKVFSIILPIQIDYSARWSEFLQSDEQFKNEINGLKVSQGEIKHVQSVFKQQIEEDLSGVHNELSQKYYKKEVDGKITDASNALKQSIEATDGKVAKLSQNLTQNYYNKDAVGKEIESASNALKQSIETSTDGKVAKLSQNLTQNYYNKDAVGKEIESASNALKQSIETSTDGKVSEAKTELLSSIEKNYAKIATSVQKDENGHLTSEIELTSDKVAINCKNFSVSRNGDVKITGNVNANSGKIAGLEIQGNGLTNEGLNNDAYIILRNDTNGTFAGIGNMETTSAATFVGMLQNHRSKDALYSANYALLVSARNAYYNEAINISGGCVSGFAMRNSVIKLSTKLERNDYNVICVNTTDITVTLPSMDVYDDGHVVRIKNLSSKKVNIKATYSRTWDGTSIRYSMPYMTYDRGTTVSGSTGMTLESTGDSCEFVWVRDLYVSIGGSTYYGAWVQYKFPRDW